MVSYAGGSVGKNDNTVIESVEAHSVLNHGGPLDHHAVFPSAFDRDAVGGRGPYGPIGRSAATAAMGRRSSSARSGAIIATLGDAALIAANDIASETRVFIGDHVFRACEHQSSSWSSSAAGPGTG